MEELEPRAAQRAMENELYSHKPTKQNQNHKFFSIKDFQEVKERIKLVRSLEPDSKQICGSPHFVLFHCISMTHLNSLFLR